MLKRLACAVLSTCLLLTTACSEKPQSAGTLEQNTKGNTAAYAPVDMTGDAAIHVMQDLVCLNYFTPSPFYVSQADTAYNKLLLQREAETLALADDLQKLVQRMEPDYLALGEIFAAAIGDETDSFSGDELQKKEYFNLTVELETELNRVPFNLKGYADSYGEWARVAGGVDSPFRVSQAKQFQMLLAMMAGYEICDGFETISVKAREFLARYPSGAESGAMLKSALESLPEKSGNLAEIAAKTSAIYKSLACAIRGNEAQALAALGEKIRAQQLALQDGSAAQDAQVFLDMDKAMYSILKTSFEENTPADALPTQIRPMSVDNSTATSPAVAAIAISPAEYSEADLPALGEAYSQFWGSAEAAEKPINAAVPAEEIVAAYRVTFDRYIADYAKMQEDIAQDAELKTLVSDNVTGLLYTENNGGLQLQGSTANMPLVVTPLSVMPKAPEVKHGAGWRIYVSGVAIDNLRCSSIINLINAAVDMSGSPPGTRLIGTSGYGMIAQMASKRFNLKTETALSELRGLFIDNLNTTLDELMDWVTEIAMNSPNGIGLGLFNIQIALDFSDEFDPHPPTDFNYGTGAFENLLQQHNNLLTMEQLKDIEWSGRETFVRIATDDYDKLIAGMVEFRTLGPTFTDRGITKQTTELCAGIYQAALEAVEQGFFSPVTLVFSGEADKNNTENPNTFTFEREEKWVDIQHWVYVEEIRSNVDVSYGVTRNILKNYAAIYNPAGYYQISEGPENVIIFVPRYDPVSGDCLLTGVQQNYATYGDGIMYLTFEIEMTGKFKGVIPGEEQGPPWIPVEKPESKPEPEKKPEEEKEKTPEETPINDGQGEGWEADDDDSDKPRKYLAILVTGEWKGTATLKSSENWNSSRSNYYNEETEPEGYRYYEDLKKWLSSDDGAGIVRDLSLTLGRRDQESMLVVAQAPAARDDYMETDFVLRENSVPFTGYLIDGVRVVFETREEETFHRVVKMYGENADFKYDVTIWETYTADLRLVVRNNKMYLVGTMSWKGNNYYYEQVYDVYLQWQGEGVPYVYF